MKAQSSDQPTCDQKCPTNFNATFFHSSKDISSVRPKGRLMSFVFRYFLLNLFPGLWHDRRLSSDVWGIFRRGRTTRKFRWLYERGNVSPHANTKTANRRVTVRKLSLCDFICLFPSLFEHLLNTAAVFELDTATPHCKQPLTRGLERNAVHQQVVFYFVRCVCGCETVEPGQSGPSACLQRTKSPRYMADSTELTLSPCDEDNVWWLCQTLYNVR